MPVRGNRLEGFLEQLYGQNRAFELILTPLRKNNSIPFRSMMVEATFLLAKAGRGEA